MVLNSLLLHGIRNFSLIETGIKAMQHSFFDMPEVEVARTVESYTFPIRKRGRKPKNLASLNSLMPEFATQQTLVDVPEEKEENKEETNASVNQPKQLLKWIGNKHRFASEIISYFPVDYHTYFEPFIGSGAVWGTLAPERAFISDVFTPLVEIWQKLQSDPEELKQWYLDRYKIMTQDEKVVGYEKIKASYNAKPNGADLLFLCRSCYGGVVRFRQRDGYMSTPCGAHKPMPPENFASRVDQWKVLTVGTTITRMDYSLAMGMAKEGDLAYCDPPYSFSQNILYGAQSFNLKHLFDTMQSCKARGVRLALSIDGTKKSGNTLCNISIPDGLFEREVLVNCGRSMLKRFQMNGQTLEKEIVADRLLLTY
jgi:DNA adenine methylase